MTGPPRASAGHPWVPKVVCWPPSLCATHPPRSPSSSRSPVCTRTPCVAISMLSTGPVMSRVSAPARRGAETRDMTGPVESIEMATQGVLVQTGDLDELGERGGCVAQREGGQHTPLGTRGCPAAARGGPSFFSTGTIVCYSNPTFERTTMTSLTIASDPADAQAMEAVENHHAQMSGELALLAANLVNAAAGGDATSARDRLVTWARESLVPHAMAEEKSLYPAGRELTEGRLLVDAMLAEHVAIVAMVDEIEKAPSDASAAASGRALQALFAVHLDKENDQLLPLLAASADHSVAGMLAGMHEVLGGHEGHDHDHSTEAEPVSGHGSSRCA